MVSINYKTIFISAEETIQNIVIDPGMLEVLFTYISNSNENIQLKQAASVMLSNYVKDYWVN
jgi:hypothetical protein